MSLLMRAAVMPGKGSIALGRWSGSDNTYQTVLSYVVSAGQILELSALEIACSDYSMVQLRVTIAGEVQFADQYIQTPFNPIFPPGTQLQVGEEILIEAQSPTSTLVDVDGAIEGKLIG